MSDITLSYDERSLSFAVPSVHGSWKGLVSADGNSLEGTWTQGTPAPLRFTRDTFVPAAKPSRADGIWLGTLHAAGQDLRVQLTVKSDASGHQFCNFDSIDQHAFGLECANVVLSSDNFSFDVPIVSGHSNGKISADGKTLSGLWTQGGGFLNLELARQSTALSPAPIAYDPALPPVDAARLKAVLDRDLANALQHGVLAAGTGTGVTGRPNRNSLFEIGSITKTFTGLILAQMVEQGKVKYDQPVRELLPAGVLPKPTGSRDHAPRLGHPTLRAAAHAGQLQACRPRQSLCRLQANRSFFLVKHGLENQSIPLSCTAIWAWASWDKRSPTVLASPIAFATLVTHYFSNDGFLQNGREILSQLSSIAHIPAVLIHGRRDISAPVITPWSLHQQWPESRLLIVESEGHGGPQSIKQMRLALDTFAGQ